MTSITTALGAGSGIDTQALVKDLVEAQFAARTAKLTKQAETLDAQVSGVSVLKAGISGFATALSALVRGGSLGTQATSSDTGIVRVTNLPDAKVAGTNVQLSVAALATAQVSATGVLAAGQPVGTGTIVLGAPDADGIFQPFPNGRIEIGTDAATPAAIAQKINAAGTGVTARVVADGNGERIVLKGATGAANAFRVQVTEGTTPGLSTLAVDGSASGPGAATSVAAADARVLLDGIEFRRSTNTIDDLVGGVRLDLQSVSDRTVAVGSVPATSALTQAVEDVVATYNELLGELTRAIDPVTGPLKGDLGAQSLRRALGGLTLAPLTTGGATGAPRTLAEIGVGTARDGTLKIDAAKLAQTLARHPDTVEAMFASGTGASGAGLSAALNAISTAATNARTGLGASEANYSRARTLLTDQQARAVADAEQVRTRMTRQFAGMDARVAAYKATQTFIEQQVDAWNSQR